MLARGPGMDVFTVKGAWPAVRKTAIDYHAPAFPGDILRFHQALTHHGRTSFTMRQTARRLSDDRLIATAEFVFVCIDRSWPPDPGSARPGPVPHHPAARASGGAADDRERREPGGRGAGQGTGGAVHARLSPRPDSLGAPACGLEGYRLIVPDLRGLGLSDAPDLGQHATYADDLAALLEALQVDEVVLVGLSMGGYVAFEFLRRHRERVRALVLFDTRAEADAPDVRRARDQQASLAREQGASAIAEHMLPKMLAPGASQSMPHVVERVRGMMLAAPVAGIAGALAAMRDRTDSTALLATLDDLPTMIVVGEHDRITPVEWPRMASTVPGARLSTYLIEVWYLGVDSATLEDVLARADIDAEQRRLARKRIRKARAKDNLKAFRRLTTTVNGTLQFRNDPPLLYHDRRDSGVVHHALSSSAAPCRTTCACCSTATSWSTTPSRSLASAASEPVAGQCFSTAGRRAAPARDAGQAGRPVCAGGPTPRPGRAGPPGPAGGRGAATHPGRGRHPARVDPQPGRRNRLLRAPAVGHERQARHPS